MGDIPKFRKPTA